MKKLCHNFCYHSSTNWNLLTCSIWGDRWVTWLRLCSWLTNKLEIAVLHWFLSIVVPPFLEALWFAIYAIIFVSEKILLSGEITRATAFIVCTVLHNRFIFGLSIVSSDHEFSLDLFRGYGVIIRLGVWIGPL